MNQVVIDNIEKIRRVKKLNKTAMAEKLGITRQTYNAFQKGRELRWDAMAKLRMNLGVDLNKLVLDDQVFENQEVDTRLNELYTDFIDYDIEPDNVRKLILDKVFKNYFSQKSFYEKLVQNNRAIADFSLILDSVFMPVPRHKKHESKEIMIALIKEAQIKTSEKRVKKNIIDKLGLLTSTDCYYILNFPKLAIPILLEYIPEKDHGLLKRLGYEDFLDKYFISQ